MPKEDPETTALKKELTDLIAKCKVNKSLASILYRYIEWIFTNIFVNILQAEQEKGADAKLGDKCGDMSDVPKIRLSTKKTLKGHINKVNSVHYSGDSR